MVNWNIVFGVKKCLCRLDKNQSNPNIALPLDLGLLLSNLKYGLTFFSHFFSFKNDSNSCTQREFLYRGFHDGLINCPTEDGMTRTNFLRYSLLFPLFFLFSPLILPSFFPSLILYFKTRKHKRSTSRVVQETDVST